MNLQNKILGGYFIWAVLICFMVSIVVHERHRISEVDFQNEELREIRHYVNIAYQRITTLSILGEGVINWSETDYYHYHNQRLQTDSLLQFLRTYYQDFVRPTQIDSLRFMLQSKEEHLWHIMLLFERQKKIDSLLINHLPDVARRATRVRTLEKKKRGIAGFFGGKRTVQVLPSFKELYKFSDSLIDMQQKRIVETTVYADSLRIRNQALNVELGRLIRNLDTQVQAAFTQREEKIAEAQILSVRLFTIIISVAIILLLLSYLTIHREIKCKAIAKRKREEIIGKLQETIRHNEELTREKQNIMQTITHELRSPLSAIRSYAKMIATDEKTSIRVRHAKTIVDASGRMAGMIDTLLNYFRLDSGKETVRPLPFQLKGIAGTLEAEFMPQMEKNGWHLKRSMRRTKWSWETVT